MIFSCIKEINTLSCGLKINNTHYIVDSWIEYGWQGRCRAKLSPENWARHST